MKELERFFIDYKVLENKAVNVDAMQGPAAAREVIAAAAQLYRERIAPRIAAPEADRAR